ncbi:cellulase CEL7A [Lentinula raphanica]|nr:cellulase CEL7A [Lentinula raphanica]
MFRSAALIAFTYLAVVYGQQAGTLTAETHPPLTWEQCTAAGSCTSQSSAVVLDANWRWLHDVNSATNCYTGNTWDATLCPDPTTCAANCALDGADYEGTYGVSTSGNALTLKFVTQSAQTNVGSRLYLMAPGSTTEYQTFQLVNQEFTFDVDVSQLPCGLNGAVYFSQMDADGGMARFSGNKAGAKFGTGYCDSQCPHDIKFIDGEANIDDWTPASNSANTGTGATGTCCSEMDIWEANSISAAVTPHPCTVTEQTACTGSTCSSPNSTAGVCDQAGCDFNSYRLGDTTFYGPGMTVDTTQPFTVVTQFVSSNNESTGTLSAIRRLYVQNGVVIQNSETNIPGITTTNEIDAQFCQEQKAAFGDTDTFDQKGGLAGMGTALADGMVLVLSIWDDYAVNMLWLDSTYPTDGDSPGDFRGSCPTDSGVPATVEAQSPNAQVTYSNIKVGPIGSTFSSSGSTGTGTGTGSGTGSSSTAPTSTGSAPAATQTVYGQCGGVGYTGPTACASGSTCTESSTYYSQCLP